VDVSAMSIKTTTMIPHMNAMTFKGRVIVIVSIVVVGAIMPSVGS
jgi:hypothetical protein